LAVTAGWLSEYIENVWLFFVGIVELSTQRRHVEEPPAVHLHSPVSIVNVPPQFTAVTAVAGEDPFSIPDRCISDT
jgi:hypothetical protein